MRDERLPLYTDICKCSVWNEYFNSTAAFDKHRVGNHGTVKNPGDRRCLSPESMREIGMAKNFRDYWVTALFPNKAEIMQGKADDLY